MNCDHTLGRGVFHSASIHNYWVHKNAIVYSRSER